MGESDLVRYAVWVVRMRLLRVCVHVDFAGVQEQGSLSGGGDREGYAHPLLRCNFCVCRGPNIMKKRVVWSYCVSWLNFDLSIYALYAPFCAVL